MVETDDFRRVLEAHSGRSLVRFFDQWFLTAGYPSLKVTFKYDAKQGEGTFRIQQAQLDDKGEGPLFELETDVGWVLDGTLHTQAVRLEQAVTSVTVKLPRDPDQVRFDPFHKVLHKLDFNPGDEKLRRQLTAAPDVIGRILAGRELAKTGRPRNIEAVADAYRLEPFWGVRAELARALGEAGAQSAVAALVDLVAWEEDPQVLETLLRALGKYRDPLVAPAASARLDAGLPYRAQMAALEALGNQRDQAPLDYLAQVATLPSPYGLAQSGALRGLAATRRAEALALLAARVGYGDTSNRARPAAVMALADPGPVPGSPGPRGGHRAAGGSLARPHQPCPAGRPVGAADVAGGGGGLGHRGLPGAATGAGAGSGRRGAGHHPQGRRRAGPASGEAAG